MLYKDEISEYINGLSSEDIVQLLIDSTDNYIEEAKIIIILIERSKEIEQLKEHIKTTYPELYI